MGIIDIIDSAAAFAAAIGRPAAAAVAVTLFVAAVASNMLGARAAHNGNAAFGTVFSRNGAWSASASGVAAAAAIHPRVFAWALAANVVAAAVIGTAAIVMMAAAAKPRVSPRAGAR